MEPMYQKGLGKKDDDEGRGGVLEVGAKASKGQLVDNRHQQNQKQYLPK